MSLAPSFDGVPATAAVALAALAAAAAQAAGTPLACIRRQRPDGRVETLACHGLPAGAMDESCWPCAQLLAEAGQLVVDDLQADSRWVAPAAPAGSAPLRSCAGVPVFVEGRAVATLAVFDHTPRHFGEATLQALAPLATAAGGLLALQLAAGRAASEHAREQRRLQDFSRAAGDWTWELDASMRYVWLSPPFDAATGLARHTLIGTPMLDGPLLDELGRLDADATRLHELLARPVPFARAITRQLIGDRRLYLSRSGVPVLDDDGRPCGWRGSTRDMTRRFEIGAIAAEREQRLLKLANQIPGFIFQYRLERDGRSSIPFAGGQVREIFGVEVPDASVVEQPDLPWRYLHEEDREGLAQDVTRSARELTPLLREYRIRRPDGAVRWLETRATPERLSDGAVLWHGFGDDITERKETELRLRRTEQQWELAAAANGIGLASLDLDSATLSFDRRAAAHHGLDYPTPPLPLEDWFAAMDEADRDTIRSGLQRALADRADFIHTFQLVRPDGSRRQFEIVARGTYGADDTPIGMVGTSRDVTEQIEADRMRVDKETAERANRAKTEFLSRVSHELRTPLNGILGFTQLMALDALHRLAPAQRQRLDRVQAAGRHLLSLIEDMLELTRIEHGAAGLEPVPVDLTRALTRALALIEPLASQHGIGLPSPLVLACWVQADSRALEQVLMNLLSNAIKYNRRGGSVALSLERVDDRAVLEVSDNGPGLSPQQQAGLFQPFNRLGAERQRIEGSGLGLVIARELSRSMGAELQLARSGPQGTTFRLDLPLSDSPPLALIEVEEALPELAETGPRSLLYIEDEPLNVVLMEELVRARPQWTLHVAYDGASGFAQAATIRPDLVLVDMNLPDTHGLSLIRRLRDLPATASLQCIALSADAMHEQVERARAAGFDDYWTKPIDVTQMLAKLSRVLATAGDVVRGA